MRLILVPSVTFTTKAPPPTYDTWQLVFGMPDANGFVTFDGPAGTLPPGSQVLVVNTGTGEVASFTADNDGVVSGTLLTVPCTAPRRIGGALGGSHSPSRSPTVHGD